LLGFPDGSREFPTLTLTEFPIKPDARLVFHAFVSEGIGPLADVPYIARDTGGSAAFTDFIARDMQSAQNVHQKLICLFHRFASIFVVTS